MEKPIAKELFQRQITLSEVGEKGQQKLQNTTVLVVGCGGLGGAIAVHLATSGIGNLHLVDFDVIAASNLHRQVYYTLKDIGKSKAEVLTRFIQKRAPFTSVTFSEKAISKETVLEAILEVDIVVDATDSLPTKYLLNDACVLQNKPLVYGSLYKFDGYVASFNMLQNDGSYSANLRDAFPEMATDVPTCEVAGTLNSIVSVIASLQINEVLKQVLALGNPMINSLLIYDSLENKQLTIALKRTVFKKEIAEIFERENYFDVRCKLQNPDWLITSHILKKKLKAPNSQLKIISVIEDESATYPFTIHQKTTLTALHDFVVEEDTAYIMVCKKGITSYSATEFLKAKFPETSVLSLQGGLLNYEDVIPAKAGISNKQRSNKK